MGVKVQLVQERLHICAFISCSGCRVSQGRSVLPNKSETGGTKSAASNCAKIRASTLSVFTFASAIAPSSTDSTPLHAPPTV
jgi:hypothetical protein